MPDAPAPDDALIQDPEGGLPRLVAILARLRDPGRGCPWDIVQSFETIAPYTIEEAYEVVDAIARGDRADLADELGDLLLQVVYHARMAEEEGSFGIDHVLRAVCDKMIRRHPHVFGSDNRDKSPEDQTRDWEQIKAAERRDRTSASAHDDRTNASAHDDRTSASALDGVVPALPALTRAVKLQNRAARVGFDWPDATAVLDKIAEETRELVEAQDPAHAAEEYGDLLFVMANLARHLDIDPEAALRAANDKFTRRFQAVEAALRAEGRAPADSDLAEMDALWDAAKRRERAAK